MKTTIQDIFNYFFKDVYAALNVSGDRPALEALLRRGVKLDDGQIISIQSINDDCACARELLDRNKVLHTALWKHFNKHLTNAENNITAIAYSSRKKSIIALLLLNLATLPMNWIINLDLPAVRKDYRKIGAEGIIITSAKQLRTILVSAGSIRSPAFSMDTVMSIFKTRMAFDLGKFALNIVPRSVPALREKDIVGNAAFKAASATLSAFVLIITQMPSAPGFTTNFFLGLPHLWAQDAYRAAYPFLSSQSDRLAGQEKHELSTLHKHIHKIKDTIVSARSKIEKDHAISKTLKQKIQTLTKTLEKLEKELSIVVQSSQNNASRVNDSAVFKYSLWAFGTITLGANTYLSRRDEPNFGGEIANAILTSLMLFYNASDSTITADDMRHKFNDFVGLLVVTVVIFCVNEELAFLDNSKWLVGMASLTCFIGNTVPGACGEALSKLVESTLSVGKNFIDYINAIQNNGSSYRN